MKKIFIVLNILLVSIISFSQDIIHLKSGKETEAKVLKIGVKEITFKRYDFPDGPDYAVLKKETEYILYENGRKESFIKNMTTPEYKALCERKVKHYYKQQKIGMAIAGVGLAGAAIIGINNYNFNINHPYDYEQQILYDFGYTMCFGAIVGGTVLYLTGRHKVKQYSEKLSKLIVGVNYSRNMKGVTLVYRF